MRRPRTRCSACGRTPARGVLPILGVALAVAACSRRPLANPVRLTLRNRTGGPVDGVIVRFDREIATVDATDGDSDSLAFKRRRLRHHPADTLRLDRGTLPPGGRVSLLIVGRDGPPRVLEARWLVAGRLGPRIGDSDITLR